MFKQKILKAYVVYYDIFEYDSFPVATWHATKRQTLWRRILITGAAARYERMRGPLARNHTYQIHVRFPYGIFTYKALIKIHPRFND